MNKSSSPSKIASNILSKDPRVSCLLISICPSFPFVNVLHITALLLSVTGYWKTREKNRKTIRVADAIFMKDMNDGFRMTDKFNAIS